MLYRRPYHQLNAASVIHAKWTMSGQHLVAGSHEAALKRQTPKMSTCPPVRTSEEERARRASALQ
ncbi:unnamed protein product [Chondrus crispus]|uniref:Uncharacterized protein n=1 Tax=Chondrus crispus TaxID=2769 RepID=R7QL89_CHOCR|nr:unnamed protein product [Chondrus crispus]CDF38160.1 unnamed protein product [Chondrus crispus]|eukprot:XP_005718029.1 unnamed protein product [Chondrus crispus]